MKGARAATVTERIRVLFRLPEETDLRQEAAGKTCRKYGTGIPIPLGFSFAYNSE